MTLPSDHAEAPSRGATADFGQRQCVVRLAGLSARTTWRTVTVVATLLAGAVVIGIVTVGSGKYSVAPGDVLGVLTGTNTTFDRVVILEWRTPRMLMALLIGAALGVSGAIFQALTRNPLGSPDMIGINFGAYTGALIVIGGLGGGYFAVAAGALVGGFGYALILYALAYRNGVAGYRLIVVGIAMGAVVSSVNQWIIIKLDFHAAVTAAVWEQGSLGGLGWQQLLPMTVCLAAVAVLLVVLGVQLPILQMGDDAAGALGVAPNRARSMYLFLGVVLVALACAAAGPISFIALAAPQIARRLTASPGVGLMASGAMGAVLLMVSDITAQHLITNDELPVGTVTAPLGGLYLVYLLIAQTRQRR